MRLATMVPDEQIKQLVKNEIKLQLESNNPSLVYTDFQETAKLSGLKNKRLRAVVNDSKFRSMLRSENGGPVYYPRQGQRYQFDYLGFAKFCRENMDRIWNLKLPK